jgi:nucleotide-binding universal stress UspA family protein
MFKNILLPVDDSEPSLRAARLGIALARQLGAKVHAHHVLAPLAAVAYLSDLIRSAPDDYRREAIGRAQRQIGAIRKLAEDAGVSFEGSYEFDHHPSNSILGAVKQYGCDLVVMGSHGRTGLGRLMMGSEAQRVLSCADVPVMICH